MIRVPTKSEFILSYSDSVFRCLASKLGNLVKCCVASPQQEAQIIYKANTRPLKPTDPPSHQSRHPCAAALSVAKGWIERVRLGSRLVGFQVRRSTETTAGVTPSHSRRVRAAILPQ